MQNNKQLIFALAKLIHQKGYWQKNKAGIYINVKVDKFYQYIEEIGKNLKGNALVIDQKQANKQALNEIDSLEQDLKQLGFLAFPIEAKSNIKRLVRDKPKGISAKTGGIFVNLSLLLFLLLGDKYDYREVLSCQTDKDNKIDFFCRSLDAMFVELINQRNDLLADSLNEAQECTDGQCDSKLSGKKAKSPNLNIQTGEKLSCKTFDIRGQKTQEAQNNQLEVLMDRNDEYKIIKVNSFKGNGIYICQDGRLEKKVYYIKRISSVDGDGYEVSELIKCSFFEKITTADLNQHIGQIIGVCYLDKQAQS